MASIDAVSTGPRVLSRRNWEKQRGWVIDVTGINAPNQDAPPIRMLLGKVGLDGHDRGVKVVARAFRDAGMEVIYTGLHQTPSRVVAVAIQEDVDVIGISILSGAHMALFPVLLEEMKKAGCDDMAVFAGGVIPKDDADALREMGVAEVIDQETPIDEVVERVKRIVENRRAPNGGKR